jgi:hypothetical protein
MGLGVGIPAFSKILNTHYENLRVTIHCYPHYLPIYRCFHCLRSLTNSFPKSQLIMPNGTTKLMELDFLFECSITLFDWSGKKRENAVQKKK